MRRGSGYSIGGLFAAGLAALLPESTAESRKRRASIMQGMRARLDRVRRTRDRRHHYNARYRDGEVFTMTDGRQYQCRRGTFYRVRRAPGGGEHG